MEKILKEGKRKSIIDENMGWLDKILGKSPDQEIKRSEKLTFGQLQRWLGEKRDAELIALEKEAGPLVDDIAITLTELREATIELKEHPGLADVPKRLQKVVKTAKPSFVASLLKVATMGEELTLETLQQRLPASLDKIGKLLTGSGRYLPLAFPDEMAAIGKKSNQLLRLAEEVKNLSSRNSEIATAFSSYEKIISLKQESAQLEISRKEAEHTLINANHQREELEKQLRKMGDSPEMKKFLQAKQQQQQLQVEKKELETGLYGLLTPLKRPLKKFRKYLQTQGQERSEINNYLEDPSTAFLTSPPGNLSELLQELLGNSPHLNLKSQDVHKLENLSTTLDRLEKIRERYSQIGQQQQQAGNMLGFSLVQESDTLERRLDSLQGDINSQQKKLEKITQQLAARKGQLPALKKRLQEEVTKIAGKEIKVDFRA